MDVRVGLWRNLSTKELMLLNCSVGEDSWESLGRRSNQSILKINQYWIFIGMTDAEVQAPILWPPDVKSWLIVCWQRLKAGEKGDDRGWDGWTVSLTRWTWIWASSRSWWWTGRPGVLWFMGSQSWTRLGDWTELNWTLSSAIRNQV